VSDYKLIWQPCALADLNRLRSFIKPHNIIAASRASATILRATERILQYPQIGQLIFAEFYELFIPFGRRGYILRYRLQGDVIIILRIWHSLEKR